MRRLDLKSVIGAGLVLLTVAAGCQSGGVANGARSSTLTPAPATSPGSGGRIVFGRPGPIIIKPDIGQAEIVVVNPNGTGARKVSLRIPVDGGGGAIWSPDGSKLLLTNIQRLDAAKKFLPFRPATVAPDGSDFKLLRLPNAPSDMFCDAWSPDGAHILCGFGGKSPGVFSVQTSGSGAPLRLTTNPHGAPDYPGDYSPDGSRIVFVRVEPGSGPNPDDTMRAALFVTNADGSGSPHQITPYGAVNPHDFAAVAHWSPNGQDIIYATPPSTHGVIHIIHADGTDRRTIDPGGFPLAPNWSPNGKQIVFTMYVGQDMQIFTANLDGTNLTQVTNTPGQKNFADWGH